MCRLDLGHQQQGCKTDTQTHELLGGEDDGATACTVEHGKAQQADGQQAHQQHRIDVQGLQDCLRLVTQSLGAGLLG